MAYFDSPKNRALWDKELAALRKERQERSAASKKSKDPVNKTEEKAMNVETNRLYRERTSYKELLAEETKAIKARRSGSEKTIAAVRTREKSDTLSMSM